MTLPVTPPGDAAAGAHLDARAALAACRSAWTSGQWDEQDAARHLAQVMGLLGRLLAPSASLASVEQAQAAAPDGGSTQVAVVSEDAFFDGTPTAQRLLIAHDGVTWGGLVAEPVLALLGHVLPDGPVTAVVHHDRGGEYVQVRGRLAAADDQRLLFVDGHEVPMSDLLSVEI